MEIWELAAALGANRPDDGDLLADESGMSWNQRRAWALEHGLPEPQFEDEPMTVVERAQMERLLANAPQGMLPPEPESPV